jgi:hypothetical protein
LSDNAVSAVAQAFADAQPVVKGPVAGSLLGNAETAVRALFAEADGGALTKEMAETIVDLTKETDLQTIWDNLGQEYQKSFGNSIDIFKEYFDEASEVVSEFNTKVPNALQSMTWS